MNLPDLSIKRPVFILCVFFITLVLGYFSLKTLSVDLFPNINFPIIAVSTVYPGAGPNEIETLVSKPIEDGISALSGMKSLSSISKEGISTVVAEFNLEVDIKHAEQQIRDRIAGIRAKLPTEIKDPVIQSFDPADQAVVVLSLAAPLAPAQLYDLADQEIRPLFEEINNVGQVAVLGGRKREIQVLLDRNKLIPRVISATQVANQIAAAGRNIPAGKSKSQGTEADVRTLGEFQSIKDIQSVLVNFYANENPVRISDVAEVRDTLEEEKTKTYVNGKQALTLSIYRKSGSNTIAVVDSIKKRVATINKTFKTRIPGFQMEVVQDTARYIRANVDDVSESIGIGIMLTIIVVFLFLGSARSTFITSIALPNSLLGAFVLMSVAGFSINIMTLLALSLAVGLLIDDAIVVRENIFRHIEMGKSPREAASVGTKEVTLAVIATTLTVIAVFGPVAFLSGIVGQFFKEFGLTVCFAMIISLLDALTMGPMLSAYFAAKHERTHEKPAKQGRLRAWFGRFNGFQDAFQTRYVKIIHFALEHPKRILFGAFLIFVFSFFALGTVPKTFLPTSDNGEFSVNMDMRPGTDLTTMHRVAAQVDESVRKHSEVSLTVLTVGTQNGEANQASVFVKLIPYKKRKLNTSQFKEILRKELTQYKQAHIKVQDIAMVGGASEQPFNVNLYGTDLAQLEKVANQLLARVKNNPNLKDVDISYRPGKPEFRVIPNKYLSQQYGISTTMLGQELRTQIEGATPAVFRENGKEYDIRVRLRDEQKNIKENFENTYIPNINGRLVRLANFAQKVETEGPSTIYRKDRGRYVLLSAALAPDGQGMAQAMTDVKTLLTSGEIKIPEGVHYEFVGQAESFKELGQNMMIAAALAVLFIYMVLASLYESFVTPLTIMLVLPLAACGASYALAITRASFDLFSMIGSIMLLGISTKNSILLVDYINQNLAKGQEIKAAIIDAGKTRLRPIIMTTMALICGMLPIAIGLNEASRQRTSMGIAIIGGLITSTILTLVVVPAAYIFIEKFRKRCQNFFGKFIHLD
jgi:HAE1 family hydrophobic/amphiphilic exporter-1